MSSSDPRFRFQSNHRHYHRYRANSPRSWEAWVGETAHGKRGPGRILRNTLIFTVLVGAVVAASLFLLRGG